MKLRGQAKEPFDCYIVEVTYVVFQLRVIHATPGHVKFELDIQKEHTVRLIHIHHSRTCFKAGSVLTRIV